MAMNSPKTVMNSPIDALRKRDLAGFAALLSAPECDPRQTAAFAALIYAAVNYYGVKPGDMARKFGVNPSTIARWASGKNAPHVMVRPIIIDWVSKYVQDEIGKPGSGPINGLNEPAVRGSGVSEVGHAGSPAAASC